MRSSWAATLLSVLAASLLAACNESPSPLVVTFSATQSHSVATSADRGGSWMLSEAKGEDLLYVAEYVYGSVAVYSYSSAKLVGRLTGLPEAQAVCVDASGDVWIGDQGGIVEFAHGGTKRLQSFSLPGSRSSGSPGTCSVDGSSGSLAVTNSGGGDSPGYLAIFRHARRPAHIFGKVYQPNACAYDSRGDLFIDGDVYPGSGFSFYELPEGRTAFEAIILGEYIFKPGGVQWDGFDVDVGDNSKNAIYRFIVQGRRGRLVGTTYIEDLRHVGNFWIQGSKIIAGSPYHSAVMIWRYPRGGNPIKTIAATSPFGVAVSVAQR